MVGTNLDKCEWVWQEKLRLLNLREENKVSESNIVESNMAESNMVEFKMAAIINLSQNEWVWVRLN